MKLTDQEIVYLDTILYTFADMHEHDKNFSHEVNLAIKLMAYLQAKYQVLNIQ